MPKGVYNHYKIRGKPKTEEHNKKNREAILKAYKRGKKMGYREGEENIAKRKDIRKKISKSIKGTKRTREWTERNRLSNIGKHKGSKNSMWKGGLSLNPYPNYWNECLKESIRQRDGYICQICGKTQSTELKDCNRKLSVHHIDYNKNNLNPMNLITLCIECHVKTNYNRDYWERCLSSNLENRIKN